MIKRMILKHKNLLINISVFIGLLLLFILCYGDIIFNSVSIVNGDGKGYYHLKAFMIDCFKNGEFPLWNPYISLGNQFFADVQSAVLDPFNIFYFLFNKLLAFNFIYVMKLTLAAFFMYLLIKYKTNNYILSIVWGVIYAFCGMLGGRRVEHVTIVTTVIYFPIIIYFIEKFRITLQKKWLIVSSLFMALQFLSGFTQLVLYFDLILFIYYIYICKSNKFNYKKSLIYLVEWIGIYLLVSSIQLIPMIKLMLSSTKGDMSWYSFTGLAYDLRILFMMFFPNIFSNIYAPFGSYSSSGMDYEIYIGIISLVYVIYAIFYHFKKDKYIRLMVFLMSFSYVWGMLPKIPILNKILYYTPILGSFRAHGRFLLISIFFSVFISAYGMYKAIKENKIGELIKINTIVLFILSLISIFLVTYLSQDIFMDKTDIYRPTLMSIFLPVFLISIHLFVLIMVKWLKNIKYIEYLLVVSMGILITLDLGRYSVDNMRFDSMLLTGSQTEEDLAKLLKEETVNNYRSLELSTSTAYDLWEFNKSASRRELVYNNYITFLDEKLKYWDIDETEFYLPKIMDKIETRNDLLSMMSIHQIVNASFPERDIKSTGTSNVLETILDVKNDIIEKADTVAAKSYNISTLEENSLYRIQLSIEGSSMPDAFYVDFYGDNYDNQKQDVGFPDLNVDNRIITAYITTSELPNTDFYFRIISQCKVEIRINRLMVEKMEQIDVYNTIYSDNEKKIIENTTANQIIYSPQKIYSIESFGTSYINSGMDSVHINNYIMNYGEDRDLTNTNTQISNISITANTVSADIRADENTFINQSQLFDSGWKAYVDGKQVKVYNVNNLIQGIEVPAGEHSIVFQYEPLEVYIGAIGTVIGLLLCIIIIWKDKIQKTS